MSDYPKIVAMFLTVTTTVIMLLLTQYYDETQFYCLFYLGKLLNQLPHCRLKMGDMGVQQAEPRLEPKKHRRQSRKRINQSILDELDDDDDNLLDEENDPILRALRNENS